MSTYTQICYHIVFSTKDRHPVLRQERREDLFRYIWGILKNRDSHLYRINGTEDHVHILSSLHQSVSLADLIKDIKTGSSLWIKKEGIFRTFSHWQDGYAAFTHSKREIDGLIEYIKRQEEHHRRTTFVDEYRRLSEEAGIEFDERYMLGGRP
jgi:REP element-mobilizing transposase RayT